MTRPNFIRQAARELPALSPQERLELRDRVLTYLHAIVEPHAPDDLAIRDRIRAIAQARLDRPEPLQELLVGLDALLRAHPIKD